MEYKFSDRVKNLKGNAIREIFKVLQDKEMISFAGGMPASKLLPANLVSKFSKEVLEADPIGVLQYGATEGYVPLKKAYIKYLERCSIYNVSLEESLIISGGQQGIDLMCKAFINKGDTVLVQKPTYLAVLHILKTYEANIVGVESSDDGLDLESLEENIKLNNPKILYLVPNFSNPTGKTMSVATRKGAYEICKKYGVVIIEDDPYRELRFNGEGLPAIKSFDDSGLVVYLSSMSKVIAPALRVGIAVGSEEIIRKMAIGKQAVDVHTNTLAQAVVEKFIVSGELDKQIKSAIPIYKAKKDLFVKTLKEEMPSTFKFNDVDGGLFIFGEFTDGTSAKEMFQEALKNKVAYVCGSDFFADGSGENTIRLNYSNATDEQIVEGIKRLAKIFKK